MTTIKIDETSTALVNGKAIYGSKVSKAAKKAIREQEKQFQQQKYDIQLCYEYHDLLKRKQWVDPKDKRQLFSIQWHMMSILLKYTIRRKLYSTNVAKMEIEAFIRGVQ